MNRKNQMVLWILCLPFVISAAVEFLPAWVHYPIMLLGVMQWFGACITITELKKEES